MSDRVKIAVVGASGRMGLELQDALSTSPYARASALVVRPGSDQVGGEPKVAGMPRYVDDLSRALVAATVAIDFTGADAFDGVLAAAVAAGKPLVTGTTGLSAEQGTALESAAQTIPLLYAANMSVGIQVVVDLIQQATRLLGQTYDIEVVEAHHRDKADAPSGTAKRLVQALMEAGAERVAAHSMRGGDVVGDHAVHFMGQGDRIEIVHRATTRQTFAQGALRCALWLADQKPGLYGMRHVLEQAR